MCDVCSPLAAPVSAKPPAAPLPEDVGRRDLRAVLDLAWPLGRTGLAAMLQGSISAPRSARASAHFGVLAAATQADVKRWIQLLELAGALERSRATTASGSCARCPVPTLPRIGSPRGGPRRRRPRSSGCAPGGSSARGWTRCPAYVVLHDATLRELAAAKPENEHELAAVKGFGPTKLERYGDDVLAVIAAA